MQAQRYGEGQADSRDEGEVGEAGEAGEAELLRADGRRKPEKSPL